MPPRARTIKDVVQAVRRFMRDHPQLNRLIAGQEHTDRDIVLGIVDAIDDWNITPPLIGSYDVATHPSMSLLIRRTVVYLLEEIIILGERNYISYNDGGGVVATSESNWHMLVQTKDRLEANYEAKKAKLKVAMNIAGALGNPVGQHTDYLYASSYPEGGVEDSTSSHE